VAEEAIYSLSGKALEELTIDGVLLGELGADDFRISGETLIYQSHKAEAAGYQQLAMNLQRAAELTRFTNQELINIYNELRPGRSSYKQLMALAENLEQDRGAPMIAALIRDAAEVYQQRLLR
jgi:propanediol dehydratase small subunit